MTLWCLQRTLSLLALENFATREPFPRLCYAPGTTTINPNCVRVFTDAQGAFYNARNNVRDNHGLCFAKNKNKKVIFKFVFIIFYINFFFLQTYLPILLRHWPAGSSMGQLAHFLQLIVKGWSPCTKPPLAALLAVVASLAPDLCQTRCSLSAR